MIRVSIAHSQIIVLFIISLTFALRYPAVAENIQDRTANPRLESVFTNLPTEGPAPQIDEQSLYFRFGSNSTTQIGMSWNDMQQNSSLGRQVVVGGGWVHNVWNHLPGPSGSDRNSYYYAYELSTGTTVSNPMVDPTANGGGFSAIGYDVTGSGRPVITYHKFPANRTKLARGDGLGMSGFSSFEFGAPGVNCQSIVTGAGVMDGPYLWPKVAVDINGSGQPVAHLVSTEYAGVQVKLSLIYYKSNAGLTAPFATCGRFVDTVTSISAVVEQDPNSDKVVIAWLAAADWAHAEAIQQRNNDVIYQESTDLGVTWLLPSNITDYDGSDRERAYTDLAALYTTDGCLHLLWTTSYFDSAHAIVGDQGARLYHWNDCGQCRSLLIDADNFETECRRGTWNKNISKMSLTECTVGGDSRLYATYTYFIGDDDGEPAPRDCSLDGYANGEIFVQGSPDGGASWGPPINLTNSASDSCALGDCYSENWSSAAAYVTDSLRIQYILDKDAGAVAYDEGGWTNNPVMNVSYPCFAVATYSHLSAEPSGLVYPFHTVPGQQKDTSIVLVNSGNAPANYNRSQSYISGSGWLSFPDNPANSTVPAGCNFSDTITVRINAPSTEGFYQALVEFEYDNGDSLVTLTVNIDIYNFIEFYLPTDQSINTTTNQINVNQAGRVGNYEQGNLFSYTAAGLHYLRDGSLIVGTSADELSWLIYDGAGGKPTQENPYGPLYAYSGLTFDNSHPSYQLATGLGVNRDSTIAFRVAYYAPKGAANSDFYVAKFAVYPGPHNAENRLQNLTTAFAVDWDIPADDGITNTSGGEDARQMIYQQGTSTIPNNTRYGALAVIREDGLEAAGGFVWQNAKYVVPKKVYQVDSLWNKMNSITKFEGAGAFGDLNSVIVVGSHESIEGTNDSLEFVIILAGQLSGTLDGLKTTIDKAKLFYCQYISTDQLGCPEYVCGDADGNTIITISDAVFLINYIFAGGPAPNPILAGDSDCNGIVTISDAVYLINFIFAGGPSPCANCP